MRRTGSQDLDPRGFKEPPKGGLGPTQLLAPNWKALKLGKGNLDRTTKEGQGGLKALRGP